MAINITIDADLASADASGAAATPDEIDLVTLEDVIA